MRDSSTKQIEFHQDGIIINSRGFDERNANSEVNIFDELLFLSTEKEYLFSLKEGDSVAYPLIKACIFGHAGFFDFKFTKKANYFKCELEEIKNSPRIQAVTQTLNETRIHLESLELKISDQENLQHENAELRQQKIVLSKQSATKSRMLSVLSHDLKTPIDNTFNMLKFLLGNDITSKEFKSILPSMVKETDKVNKLVQELLLWAKSQIQHVEDNDIPINLWVAVQDAKIEQQATLIGKNIDLRNEIPKNIFTVFNAMTLKIVLRNIINNAIKYSHRNGEITISSKLQRQMVWVEIEDQGVGISIERLELLRKGLIRNSVPGTSNEQGNSIGLAMVQDILITKGGELKVESKESIGTKVSFNLPLIKQTNGQSNAHDKSL